MATKFESHENACKKILVINNFLLILNCFILNKLLKMKQFKINRKLCWNEQNWNVVKCSENCIRRYTRPK